MSKRHSSSKARSPDQITTDHELAQGILSQDLKTLQEIYQRHSSLVYTLALKILNNTAEAEDLTQDIFLKLWQKKAYNPQRGSLRSYLATVTRSQAIDRIRVKTNRQNIISRWQKILGPTSPNRLPMEQATWNDRQTHIRAALETLPEEQRKVLELSYFHGMSQSAIATQLDRPLGTVKTWARKGLLQLRAYYQSHDLEP